MNNKTSDKERISLKDIIKAKSELPYEFIPVDPEKNNITEINYYNENSEDLYTGECDCSMYVLNSLLVGNKHSAIDDDITKIEALKVDNQILISPHSLKGMISSFIAQLLQIPIKRLNDRKFLFRPNVSYKEGFLKTVPAIITNVIKNNDTKIIELCALKEPYVYVWDKDKEIPLHIEKNIDDWIEKHSFLKNCTAVSSSIRNRKGTLCNIPDKKIHIEFTEYTDGLDGAGSFAELFNKKNNHRIKHHNVFGHGGMAQDQKYILDNSKLVEYDNTINVLASDHFQDHPLKPSDKISKNISKLNSKSFKINDIIFLEVDQNRKVYTFGRTFYYPWAYQYSIKESPNYSPIEPCEFKQTDNNKINLGFLRNLFGYTLQKDELKIIEDKLGKQQREHIEKEFNSKAGKVHFNFATYIGGGEVKKDTVYLAGTPKASSYEFYLKQDDEALYDESKSEHLILNTWGDPAHPELGKPLLSGRKVYKRTINLMNLGIKREEKSESDDWVCYKEDKAPSYPMFKFKCRFNNLTKTELFILMFALHLNETSFDIEKKIRYYVNKIRCHQMGFGKNFGRGAIKITVDNIRLYTYKDDMLQTQVIEAKEDESMEEYLKNNNVLQENLILRDKKYKYPGELGDAKTWHSAIRKKVLDNRRSYKEKWMNIMFETIGKRDLMGIFLNHTYGTKYRVQIKDEELKNFDYLKPIYDVSYSNEPNYNTNKNDDLIGYTCPMLFKSLRFMIDHKINMIDHLILIATNRKNIENKLEAIEKILEDEENINTELIDYLQNGIIKYIKTDNTAETADVIKNIITQKKPDFLNISINKVTVLELGTYGYFNSIIEFDLKNMPTLDLISRADINKLDFFEYELYFGLQDMFKTFENANIYLATFAGGMPLMQRALDNILNSVVCQKKLYPIFNSEYLAYQIEHKPQGEILSLFRKMNQAVVRMDWDNVKLFYNEIKSKHPAYISNDSTNQIDELLKKVDEFIRSKEKWFSHFFFLIMKSLYEQNYNDVAVWLKCLEEAILNKIFSNNVGVLWDAYKIYDPNNKSKQIDEFKNCIRRFKYVSWNNEQGETIYCEAYLNKILDKLQKPENCNDKLSPDKVKTTFSSYFDCFPPVHTDKNDKRKALDKIRNARNNLIHQGIPVCNDKSFINMILNFLNIEKEKLDKAINAYNEMNFEQIKKFEKSVLENSFFAKLTPYAKSETKEQVNIMSVREFCDKFFQILHL